VILLGGTWFDEPVVVVVVNLDRLVIEIVVLGTMELELAIVGVLDEIGMAKLDSFTLVLLISLFVSIIAAFGIDIGWFKIRVVVVPVVEVDNGIEAVFVTVVVEGVEFRFVFRMILLGAVAANVASEIGCKTEGDAVLDDVGSCIWANVVEIFVDVADDEVDAVDVVLATVGFMVACAVKH